MKRDHLLNIICSVLVMLWTYAAVSKWMQFRIFVTSLFNQELPRWSIYPLSLVLPLGELLIAAALFFNEYRKKGLWASLILLSAFTVYISAILLHFFPRIPCSCGGVISTLTWKDHLWLNVFFLVLSFAGLATMRDHNNKFLRIKSPPINEFMHEPGNAENLLKE